MFVSEEARRFVWTKLHILPLNKHLKKRAVHDALFGWELLQRNTLIKMKILMLTSF